MEPQLSEYEKKVNLLFQANTSIKNISFILNKSNKSISNTLYRIKKKNKLFNGLNKKQNQDKIKLFKREKRIINRDLIKSPKKTNKRILYENNINITKRSLQRYLREEKYSINICNKKPFLNKKKAKIRLEYAKKIKKKLENINLNKIIFSDELVIKRGLGSRQEYYRKRRNKKVGPELASIKSNCK